MFNRHCAGALLCLGLVAAPTATAQDQPVAGSVQSSAGGDFSGVQGGAGRVFFVNREGAASLTIRNDGESTWDAGQDFHLSYRWRGDSQGRVRWRGSNTQITEAVPPGATVVLEMRLRTPDAPGFYRLQSRMAQMPVPLRFDQRPASGAGRLIVVLPRAELGATLLAPVLTALTLLGLTWVARRGWPGTDRLASIVAGADLMWCGISLWGKQVFFYSELPWRFVPSGVWLPVAALAVPLLAVLVLPRRFRAWDAGSSSCSPRSMCGASRSTSGSSKTWRPLRRCSPPVEPGGFSTRPGS